MGFKWRSVKKKNQVVTLAEIEEISKNIKILSNNITAEGDIDPIDIEFGSSGIIQLEYIDKLRDDLDYLKENNYCRIYGQGECTANYVTKDSAEYSAEQISNLSSLNESNNTTEYSSEDITYFNNDYADNESSYLIAHNVTVQSSKEDV